MADAMPPKPVIDAAYWSVASWVTQCFSVVQWLGAGLTTLCIVLLFAYLHTKPADPWYIKALAIFSCVLQCAVSVFELLGHSIQLKYYAHQTIGPGMVLPWTAAGNVFITCLSGLCAQGFFGRLVYQLMHSRRAPKIFQWLWLLVFTLLWLFIAATGIATSILFIMIPERYWIPAYDSVNLSQLPSFTYVSWMSTTAALDVILAVTLVGRFVKDIKRDGFKETNSLLTSLAISTLETFALTAVLATADAMMGAVYNTAKTPLTQVKAVEACYFITIICSRAYCISLLYTLRRRSLIRDQRFGPRSHGSSSGGEAGASSKRNHSSGRVAAGLGVDRRRAGSFEGPIQVRVDGSYPPLPMPIHPPRESAGRSAGQGAKRIKVETQKQVDIDPLDDDEEAKEYAHPRGMQAFDEY